MSITSVLAALPVAAYASAALAGLAAWLAVSPAGGRWPALARSSGRLTRPTGRWDRLWAFVRGRPDAPALTTRLLLGLGCATALCLAGSRFAGGPGALCWFALPVLSIGGLLLLGWLEPLRTKRRRAQLVHDAPQALELMSACLAAGMPVRGANHAIVTSFTGPVAEDLGRVRALVSLGVPDSEAWLSLHEHPQFGPAADDLARSVESGTMLVQSLRHHSSAARDARRGALLVRARGVGVRSVLPLMVCFIPAFMLLGVVPTVVSALSRALG